MVVEKKICEYSGRKRININMSDEFDKGDEVVLLSKEEYNHIKEALFSLQMKQEAYESRQSIIEETIEKTLKRMGIGENSEQTKLM